MRIVWDEGHEGTYPAREIRLRCSCAHCVEEMTGRPLLDPARVPEDLTIRKIELVGNYGIQIEFSDGHGTGIYHFRNLLAWCPCDHCRARRDAGTTSGNR